MKEIHVISLGAGVQSSTMALMAGKQIQPMPVAAIFADTQAEPQSVYRWLDWLETQLPFPVIRVSAGNLTSAIQKGNRSFIPAFVGEGGMLFRKCTREFKVNPIVAQALKLGEAVDSIIQWIGISLDEAHRMKPSKQAKIRHRWPLMELEMKRYHCENWLANRGLKAPRSACIYCPYHSDNEWRRLKENEPEEFRKAVEFEREFQARHEIFGIDQIPFLHSSRIALDQVDFSTDLDRGQLSLWGNECEGMCGV